MLSFQILMKVHYVATAEMIHQLSTDSTPHQEWDHRICCCGGGDCWSCSSLQTCAAYTAVPWLSQTNISQTLQFASLSRISSPLQFHNCVVAVEGELCTLLTGLKAFEHFIGYFKETCVVWVESYNSVFCSRNLPKQADSSTPDLLV